MASDNNGSMIVLESYGNIEWTILPTSKKDTNKYQYKYSHRKILFIKLTEKSDDEEFMKHSYYFLLMDMNGGDMKVWLQSDTQLVSSSPTTMQISDGPNTNIAIEFSSDTEFSLWFDEVRQTMARLVINHTLHTISCTRFVQTPLLFQCLKRCYELDIKDHELDLHRIRNLLAVKQQILHCVNGWQSKSISCDAILFTINSFMCHILLAHFEPLILGRFV